MLSSEEYIRISLEYDLFWVRIMKEHAIFIESSVPASQKQLAMQADQFKQQYDRLLAETIRLANNSVSSKALQAGQYVTRYTEASEQAVQQLTGIEINSNLTKMEYNIQPASSYFNTQQLEQQVSTLNQYILNLTNAFARFKSDLMNSQATCRLFTFLYYADLNHIFHEAMRYIDVLNGCRREMNDSIKITWSSGITICPTMPNRCAVCSTLQKQPILMKRIALPKCSMLLRHRQRPLPATFWQTPKQSVISRQIRPRGC